MGNGKCCIVHISIHAPRGGSDTDRVQELERADAISIHAPREGSDLTWAMVNAVLFIFQSTLPAGGATMHSSGLYFCSFISIHAPRGGSDYALVWNEWFRDEFQSTLPAGGATNHNSSLTLTFKYFNPRSPRGERQLCALDDEHMTLFQSTLPAGGATQSLKEGSDDYAISIHAPRGGSDKLIRPLEGDYLYFNPRSPRGERPASLR